MSQITARVIQRDDQKFRAVALGCARKVLLIAISCCAAIALVGYLLEHIVAVKASLFSLFTLGGHFWGSISIGVAGMSILAWACCVGSHEELAARNVPFIVGFIGAALWFCAWFAMRYTYTGFDDLTVYQALAGTAMYLPFVGLILSVFFLLSPNS